MTPDPAVLAAAEALVGPTDPCDHAPQRSVTCGWCDAEAAVAAARPIIEAEVRERIAADIEALPPHVVLSRSAAAQIARGTA